MNKILFLTFIAAALLIFTQATAFACSCPDYIAPYEQKIKSKLKNAQAVFSGKVLEIKEKPQSHNVFVKIEVGELWKGNLFKEVTITTNRSPTSCGYPFEVGKSYLIYAHGSDESNLITGLCWRNLELQKATEELKILGEGKKPRKKNG